MRWSRILLGQALLTAVLCAGAAVGLVSSAAASPPQPVQMHNVIVADPCCSLTFSATGGVFGSGVSGTFDVVSGFVTHVPPPFPISIVGTVHREDVYTPTGVNGTFTLRIQKLGRVLPGASACTTVPGDDCSTIVYQGSATVAGGPAPTQASAARSSTRRTSNSI
jgi:hypothetical protein